jgi:hypothetical protein
MAEFLPLEELRDRVWPLAARRNLATDMTGVSLPILDIQKDRAPHPYQVLFLLYYAVPETADPKMAHKITRPYAWLTLDLESGELVNTHIIRSETEPNPLVGPGVLPEVVELPDNDRRSLQDLFFSRCNEAAQVYAAGAVSPAQAEHLADLLSLFETLSEPPLRSDYEDFGKVFFAWLREHAHAESEK